MAPALIGNAAVTAERFPVVSRENNYRVFKQTFFLQMLYNPAYLMIYKCTERVIVAQNLGIILPFKENIGFRNAGHQFYGVVRIV